MASLSTINSIRRVEPLAGQARVLIICAKQTRLDDTTIGTVSSPDTEDDDDAFLSNKCRHCFAGVAFRYHNCRLPVGLSTANYDERATNMDFDGDR